MRLSVIVLNRPYPNYPEKSGGVYCGEEKKEGYSDKEKEKKRNYNGKREKKSQTYMEDISVS